MSVSISPRVLEEVRGAFPVVAANITSGELKRMRPLLAPRVSPGGYLILSGLLREEAPLVSDLYTSEGGFRLFRTYVRGEWGALVLQKSAERFSG